MQQQFSNYNAQGRQFNGQSDFSQMGYGGPRTQDNYYPVQRSYGQQFPGYMPPSIG